MNSNVLWFEHFLWFVNDFFAFFIVQPVRIRKGLQMISVALIGSRAMANT